MQHNLASPEVNRQTDDIEIKVDLFQPDPMPASASALAYWESIKEDNFELYQIAMAIFSVPPTEVQIERDFSSLGWVFSERRTRLRHDLLEDIMIIYLNKELYEIVSLNHLKEEMEKNHIKMQ